jgi:hypothetical protein
VELNLGIPVAGIHKNVNLPKYNTSLSTIRCNVTLTAEFPNITVDGTYSYLWDLKS